MKWNRLGRWALGMAISASLAGGALAESTASKRIAFSNSYAGNAFRQAMLESWEHVAAQAIAAGKIKAAPVFTTADNSATEQAAQIENLVLQGFDAIVVNAASPTALNGAIKKACQAGVVVVSFDGIVTEPCAYRVTHNYRNFGEEQMRYLSDALPNGGNVLELRGIAGTYIDNEVSEGVHDALKSMPKFKLVASVYGNWNPVDSQKAVAGVLPSLSKVDVVLNAGGGTGVIRAFEIAGRPVPLVTLGNQYDELSWWQEKRGTGYNTRSAGANPGIASFAFWVAQQALEGRKMPKDIEVPFLVVTPEALDSTLEGMKPGGNVTQDFTLDNVSNAMR